VTHSERVFDEICQRAGYAVERPSLRDREGVATADFIVRSGSAVAVVEVEELRPNQDDIRQIREMEANNFAGGGCTIGARPRKHIRRAARQLKPYAAENIPLVIALYDNVRIGKTRVAYPMFYLQPHDIDAAMYGDRTAHISIATSGRARPDRNGGKQTCTASEKNYVSAVAVISDHDDATVIFYHNRFAKVALRAPLFRGKNFFHLAKVIGEPWKWAALD
jgi:hypothetical protein